MWELAIARGPVYLPGEAAQAAARGNPDWRCRYVYLMMRRQKRIAKVAMARKLAAGLYWMWRNNWQYAQSVELTMGLGNKLQERARMSLSNDPPPNSTQSTASIFISGF